MKSKWRLLLIAVACVCFAIALSYPIRYRIEQNKNNGTMEELAAMREKALREMEAPSAAPSAEGGKESSPAQSDSVITPEISATPEAAKHETAMPSTEPDDAPILSLENELAAIQEEKQGLSRRNADKAASEPPTAQSEPAQTPADAPSPPAEKPQATPSPGAEVVATPSPSAEATPASTAQPAQQSTPAPRQTLFSDQTVGSKAGNGYKGTLTLRQAGAFRIQATPIPTSPAQTLAPTPAQTPEPTRTPKPTATPGPSPTPRPLHYGAKEKVTLDETRILPELQEIYQLNHDLVGWLTIPGTYVDYPVVQCEDSDFYLTHDFYGEENKNGQLIMDTNCDVYTPSYNLVISGHAMKNFSMFGTLINYSEKSYWKARPIVEFDSLMDRRQYVVFAAFYSADYAEDEEGFRYNADIQTRFDAEPWLKQIRENQLYDTGIDVRFGDEFLTLTTCSSVHQKNGRFVVVCRKIREGEEIK